MEYVIIKPDAELDEYVVWCVTTDTPVWCGTRAELLRALDLDTHGWFTGPRTPRGRVDWADQRGSSDLTGQLGWWRERDFVYEAKALLPRTQLATACRMLAVREQLAEVLAAHDRAFARMMTPLKNDAARETTGCTAPHAAPGKVAITGTGHRHGDDRTVDVHLHGPADHFVHVVDALDHAHDLLADDDRSQGIVKALRDVVNWNAGQPVALPE